MTEAPTQAAEEVATAARAFVRLGYINAFGHVSRRIGSTMLITPTRPGLGGLRGSDVLALEVAGAAVDLPATCPIEALAASLAASRASTTRTSCMTTRAAGRRRPASACATRCC